MKMLETTPERTFTRTGVPSFRLRATEPRRERTVVGGDREDPVGADHPDRAGGEQGADEAKRHHHEQRMSGAAVDAVEDLVDRVHEAAEPAQRR